MAELSPSEAQARVQRAAAALLEAECPTSRVRAAEPLGHDAPLWRALETRLAALTDGADLVALALAAQECGRALAPVPFAEHSAAQRLLARAGHSARIEPVEVAAIVLREPRDGVAALVPAGAVATLLIALDGDALVLARSPCPGRGPRTLSCQPLADRRIDAPGREQLARAQDARALHASGVADWQVLTAAALVGLADRALALCLAHVREREQFGVPIGSFQAIQHRLADRATELEGARLLVLRAAWAGNQEAADRLAWASAAFLFASAAARATTAAALQFHGGAGYTLERDIQLFHRRAKGWPLALGDLRDEWRRLGALLFGAGAPPASGAARADAARVGRSAGGIDFSLGARGEAFRAEVRDFLDRQLDAALLERTHRSGTVHDWGFHRALAAKGWIGAAWPVAEGGQGRDPWEMRVFAEECARRDAPTDALATTLMVAGTLREVGTELQKREILPRVLRGEITLCLGYSEPNAGSDLASVETRARRDGDDWIVDGEKSFTSLAHEASYVFLLARTNPAAPKHRGLTMFLVPMQSEGIGIEPVYTLGAPGRTNRSFYRGVRVPDALRVGEVDGGWAVVNVALTLERGGMFGAVRSLEQAQRWAAARGRLSEPEVRARLARVWTENEVASLLGLEVSWISASGRLPGVESAMSKLFSSESVQRSTDDLLDLLGPEALLPETEPDSPAGGAVEFEWRKSAVGTIYAGTSEVLRTLIAERHLALPRRR